jgi:Bacteroidetes-specific putative membrane protein
MLFTKVKGQSEPQITQYWALPSFFNPSVVGNDDKLKVSAMDRMQWVGIKNAPKTFLAIAETPFHFMGLNNGFGALVISDQVGLFKTNSFMGQYALHLKLGKGVLSLGLRAGAVDYTFDGTKVDIPESDAHNPSDESIPKTSIGTMGFDAGFGIDYSWKGYYLSFSSIHLTAPELELNETSMLVNK